MAECTAGARRRPVRAVPEPKAQPVQVTPMQLRVVLAGEPMTLAACRTCGAMVPGGDKVQQFHRAWHERHDR